MPWIDTQGTGTMPLGEAQQIQQGQQQAGINTNGPPPLLQNQMFGSTPATIAQGGLVAPTDAGQTANALNQIMNRKAPTIAGADFSGMAGTQASQLGLLNQMRGYAQGLGPSAAQIGNTMAMGQAATAGRGALGGGNALAARSGLLGAQGGVNNAAMQGAGARSAETGQMMGALGSASNGLAGNALGARSLADLQIQQQQALGLGQAQRNYQLGQGTLGTALQEQQDRLNFASKMAALQQQRQNDIVNSELKIGASSASAMGSGFTGGST